MRSLCIIGIAVALTVGCAHAQQPAPPIGPVSTTSKQLSGDSSVDDILDALDARGKELKDFTANVTLTDTDLANGTDSTHSGKMAMQKLPGDDARLRVTFDKKSVNGGKETPDKSEYTLGGGWLTERNYPDRREVRRQVLRPGQKMNLLKLGEGPFPLPLGQDKADVHKMFEVTKIPPKAADDPPGTPGTIHAQLVPKPGTQFEPKFKSIDVWVDPATKMPVKIQTLDPNQTTTRTTELKDIKVNAGLGEKDFELPKIDQKEWSIREQPFEE